MNIKKTGLFLVRFFIIIKEELFYFFGINNIDITPHASQWYKYGTN